MQVLIADDDLISLKKLEKMLVSWGYETVSFRDGTSAWEAIQQPNRPRLLLLDWMMPGMDGIDICREVRKHHEESYTYIVMLTSKNEKEDIIAGMEAGADDYLTKPYYSHELKVRLRAGRRILELNEELLEARDALKERATVDALTGISNRGAILDAFAAERDRSGRENKDLSIAIMDIDHFKNINDTYGHIAGDQVLREVAKRLKSGLRQYDAVGRYGGEEFLLIISGASQKVATEQADRLRRLICDKPMDTTEGIIPVSASFGVSIVPKNLEIKIETIIDYADKALYNAKEGGRNCVKCAEETPS